MGVLTTAGTCDQCNDDLPDDEEDVVQARGQSFCSESCRDTYVKEHEEGTAEHEDEEDENVCQFC